MYCQISFHNYFCTVKNRIDKNVIEHTLIIIYHYQWKTKIVKNSVNISAVRMDYFRSLQDLPMGPLHKSHNSITQPINCYIDSDWRIDFIAIQHFCLTVNLISCVFTFEAKCFKVLGSFVFKFFFLAMNLLATAQKWFIFL